MSEFRDSLSISTSSIFLSPIYTSCLACNQYYSFEIIGSDKINLECRCKFITCCKLSEFIKEHCSKIPNNFGCKNHENIKNIYYCKDCKIDLCKECLKAKAKDVSDGKRKMHDTHTLVDLLDIKQEMEEIKKFVEMENDDNEIHHIGSNVKKLILNLINHYDENPTYNAYKSIKKAKKFLNQPKDKIIMCGEYAEFKKINSINELEENLKSPEQISKIYKIEIDGTGEKPLEDLNNFQNKEFNALKNIKLINFTNLIDIQALSSCQLHKLEILLIGNANLSDNIIKTIINLKLPEIKFISFYKNKITFPEIFNAIKNFKKIFFRGEFT